MEYKRYSVYQIVLAYLFGRYQAYKEDGLFKDTSFNEFVMLVCTAKVGEDKLEYAFQELIHTA